MSLLGGNLIALALTVIGTVATLFGGFCFVSMMIQGRSLFELSDETRCHEAHGDCFPHPVVAPDDFPLVFHSPLNSRKGQR